METTKNFQQFKMVSVKIDKKTFFLAFPTDETKDTRLLVVHPSVTREYKYNVLLPQIYIELWWNLESQKENVLPGYTLTLTGEEYTEIATKRLIKAV